MLNLLSYFHKKGFVKEFFILELFLLPLTLCRMSARTTIDDSSWGIRSRKWR